MKALLENLAAENGVHQDQGSSYYVIISLDEHIYAVKTDSICEIAKLEGFNHHPNPDAAEVGSMQLRNKPLKVYSLKKLVLQKADLEYDKKFVLVTEYGDHFFGFIVDDIHEIKDVKDETISKGDFSSPVFGSINLGETHMYIIDIDDLWKAF